MTHAVILAGGKGTRMAPITAPKCLMPVRGLPILYRIIKHLKAEGVDTITVAVGYKAEDVISAITSWGIPNVETSDAGEEAAPCKRVLFATSSSVGSGPVLVCYGDELADVHVDHLNQYHSVHKAAATITEWPHQLDFGLIKSNPSKDLVSIKERAEVPVNIGFMVLSRESLGFMKPNENLVQFVNGLVHRGLLVKVFRHEGKRATVNAPQEVGRAEEVWK